MLEALILQYARVHIVFEMAVVERYANAIQLQAGKEFGISFCKEVLKPLVKEEFVFVLSKDFEHGLAVLRFVSRKACNKVLHAVDLLAEL